MSRKNLQVHISTVKGSSSETPMSAHAVEVKGEKAEGNNDVEVPACRLENNSGMKIRGKAGKPFTILVEGNIGCGKSTFTKHFLEDKSILTLLEPLEEYRDAGGTNLLEKMYEDPCRYGYLFQHHVMNIMCKRHSIPTDRSIKVLERSIHSPRCFIEVQRRLGYIEDVECHVFDEAYKSHVASAELNVDLIVYLQASPETAYNRVLLRSRAEETNITLEYLKVLHEVHEEWLIKRSLFHNVSTRVLVLDASQTPEKIFADFWKAMEDINQDFESAA